MIRGCQHVAIHRGELEYLSNKNKTRAYRSLDVFNVLINIHLYQHSIPAAKHQGISFIPSLLSTSSKCEYSISS